MELEQKLFSLKEDLFNLRYQSNTGRLEKPSRIRNIKREVARINTIIKEKEVTSPPRGISEGQSEG